MYHLLTRSHFCDLFFDFFQKNTDIAFDLLIANHYHLYTNVSIEWNLVSSLRDSLMHESAAVELEMSPAKPDEVSIRSGKVRRLLADALFGAARELVIEHGGEEYRLRITQAGKLILTK